MRILIATLYGNYGGSTKVLLASAAALRGAFDVDLRAPFSHESPSPPEEFPIETLGTAAAKLRVLPLVARQLRSEWAHVARHRPDLIYVHDTPSLLVYGLIGRLRRIPVVYHVHGEEGAGPGRRLRDALTGSKIFIARFLADPAWRGPSYLLANPITPPAAAPRDRSAKRRLCVVASLSDRKNQMLAVATLAELRRRGRDADLDLYGPTVDPDYRARLLAEIERYGLGTHVHLKGVRPPAEIYAAADVILCPSKFEAQPLVLLEAMSAGVPVVASRIPAHCEIAEATGIAAGEMLADLDPRAFADRIDSLDVGSLAPHAARIAALYDPQVFARRLRDIFAEIARRQAGRKPPP